VEDASPGGCHPNVSDVPWNLPEFGPLGAGAIAAVPVWNGSGYTVVWRGPARPGSVEESVFASRLTPGGAEIPEQRKLVAAWADMMQIASSGSSYAVVYTDYQTAPSQIRMRILDAALDPIGGEIQVSNDIPKSGVYSRDAHVAWNPVDSEWGVVWTGHDTTANFRVQFRRVSAAGVVMGDPQQPGPLGSYLESSGGTPLIWNGNGYAVVWRQSGGIVLRLIGRDGVPGGSSLAAIPPAGQSANAPAVARGPGGEFGLVWNEAAMADYTQRLWFSRASSDGSAVPNSSVQLSTSGSSARVGGIAWDGAGWVVTWMESPALPGAEGGDIWTARVDGSGALIPGTRQRVSCASPRASTPIQAHGGGQTAVTFIRLVGIDITPRIAIFR
jgi:hypothetical protein